MQTDPADSRTLSPPDAVPSANSHPHAPSPSVEILLSNPKSTMTENKYIHQSTPDQSLEEIERRLRQQRPHLSWDEVRSAAKAELKRLRHCAIVRQSRARKKNARKDLKKVNDELETQLQTLVDAYKQRPNWYRVDESSTQDVLFKKFLFSLDEVHGLRSEQSDLKSRLMLHGTLGEQLQRLQSDYEIPRQIGTRPSVGKVHFREITQEEARAIMIDSHRQATSFFEAMRSNKSENVGETMGWTRFQRITPEGSVQFNFTKRLHTIRAHDLVEKSWAMYCDFDLYHGVYASVQRLEILQHINEDTLLFRRDLQESPDAPIFRTVFLLFRIRLSNGYLICFRSHNPHVFVDDDDDPNVEWMEMFYWLMITDPPMQAPGQLQPVGCDVAYGGNILDQKSAKHALLWKYEVAITLLRWESNAVAPLFSFNR